MSNNWNRIYDETDNSELRRLQLAELDILHFFIKTCEKYSLRYYLIGGTMLGAIRHKGFIPWDDDTDVGMPRNDYEKFIQIVYDEIPDGYDFLNYKTKEDYKRYFSRIVNTKIKVHNNSNSKEIVEDAWLDIFPYDGMPSNRMALNMHFWYMTCLRFFYHASCFEELVNLNRPDRAWYLKIAIKFLSMTHLGANLNTKKIMTKLEQKLMSYSFDSSEYIVNFFGAKIKEEVIPKQWMGKDAKYRFEDVMACGPKEYDSFLSHFYGNYMKVPSVNCRDKHNITKIEYLE